MGNHTPAKLAVVDLATLTKPGFIAIYEDRNGQMGKLLGVSNLLTADTHENVSITLSRKTVNGEVLLAIVHIDNGDGKFDPPAGGLGSDEPAKDESGSLVSAQFGVASQGSGGQIPSTGLGGGEE